MPSEGLTPDWAWLEGDRGSRRVRALMSTRLGGVSAAPFDSLNLARPVATTGEAADAVAENRRRFAAALGAQPVFLHQLHGSSVVSIGAQDLAPGAPLHQADASVCAEAGIACTVLVADCLPVLFAARNGRAVAAAHAGWRGLAAGVLQNTLSAVCDLAACEPHEVLAWLGPCIGPRQFEVGTDVHAAFVADCPAATAAARQSAFRACRRADGTPGWFADLPLLARHALESAGVSAPNGGVWCTVEDRSRFFSFRRDRITGRMAAAIALVA